jgi:hypothetical protein
MMDQIEQDALNESVPLATALRKCVALGGQSGSEALRDWAAKELNGYHGDDEIPSYRTIGAPLRLDGMPGNYRITGETLPPMALPVMTRDVRSRRQCGDEDNPTRQPRSHPAPMPLRNGVAAGISMGPHASVVRG